MTKVTILIDQENAAQTWWDAACDGGIPDVPATLVPLLFGGESEVTVSSEEAATALAWAATLPGWDDGPAYARHPLLTR